MKIYNVIVPLLSMLLLPATSHAASLYDESVIDGTRQARAGNPVTPPISLTAHFISAPTPTAPGTLEILASGDFDAASEYLDIYVDGIFLDSAFQFAGLEVVASRTLQIPLSTLQSATADSAVDISLIGTSGGAANVNILTVNSIRLSYSAVPLPPSWSLMIGAIGSIAAIRNRRRIRLAR